MDRDDSGNDCIHIIPSIKSSSIKNWRPKCKDIVDSFLNSFSGHTVPVQPDQLPKLQQVIEAAKSKPSVYFEKQTILQVVAATKQQVDKVLDKIQHLNTQDNLSNDNSKPCIILW